jgi:hypothetical protein
MGRLYVALEDRQVEYQSNMIEVESNFINHPVTILIDSREIHFCIDPKIVDRLHLKRVSLKNQVWFIYPLEPKEGSMIWSEIVP